MGHDDISFSIIVIPTNTAVSTPEFFRQKDRRFCLECSSGCLAQRHLDAFFESGKFAVG